MIIDLKQFIEKEKACWEELEAVLDQLEKEHTASMSLDEVRKFHYLYERVSADLARISSFSSERGIQKYLESLVARAYGEIHETREKPHQFRPVAWFFVTFPQTFRKHIRAFYLSTAITLAGCIIGGMALGLDASSREILMPFDHLIMNPKHRVAEEEKVTKDHLKGVKVRGAAWYMANNTQVALVTMAMGATWGIGTIIMLFSTGIMLGSVAVDYMLAGQTKFLCGWLLPHGSIEIPAILLAGQAGFMLAGALIGWRQRIPLKMRLRTISGDLVTLIFGVALMLVWAGFIEAFLSQYHEPTIPYSFKIAFGCIQLIILTFFLSRSGKNEALRANVSGIASRATPEARSFLAKSGVAPTLEEVGAKTDEAEPTGENVEQ